MKKLVFLFSALAVMVLTGCNQQKPDFTDNEYPVITVGTQSANLQTTYPAVIKGVQDVEIRPKVSGFITKLLVHEGQSVGAGQLLFVLDNVTFKAAERQAQAQLDQARASLTSAKAQLNSAKAQLNTARLTYTNSQSLHQNNVIGSYELETARNNYETAQAQVGQAEASVNAAQANVNAAQASVTNARENLSYCYVKSPAAGVIGSLPFKVGALVSGSSAQPLTTVSNISTMEVYFSMTEKDILAMTKTTGSVNAAINSYPAVQLQLADGTIYNHQGRVEKMDGLIDQTTGTVSLIARFPNPERLLKSGGAGSIVVPNYNSSAIIIPQEATSQLQNKIFVYVVGADNKVRYTEIKVNPQNDGKSYIVTGGLKAGDRIVTKGITALTDGMEIKPITEQQYEKKLKETEKLGEAQGDMKKFKKAMGAE